MAARWSSATRSRPFDSVPDFYHIPEERTKPFGTTQAVLCTREFIHEPFCVINADDYYGVDAYRTIYQALQTLPEKGEAVMVGYLLKNTVTQYGTVSRGVCHTADGKLTDIRETLKIQLFPDGSIADVADGQRHELDGDSVVSMNFWGFSPAIFDGMEQYFHDFLRRVGDDPKAECLAAHHGGRPDEQGRAVGLRAVLRRPVVWHDLSRGSSPCGGGAAKAPRRGGVSRQAGVRY